MRKSKRRSNKERKHDRREEVRRAEEWKLLYRRGGKGE